MNVSMMDSFNLTWKLAHSINGLTPAPSSGAADPVLETFEPERADTARQLIAFDTMFSHIFSRKDGVWRFNSDRSHARRVPQGFQRGHRDHEWMRSSLQTQQVGQDVDRTSTQPLQYRRSTGWCIGSGPETPQC
jgi:2-polyprenyl-6-methoxyphenol hydroxylase-like FAD-dependent oxidoreductase